MHLIRRAFKGVRTAYTRVRRFIGYLIFERPLGLETWKPVTLRELGLDATYGVDYEPSPWLVLRRVLSPREVGSDDVFLDFGSGKGPAVLQAARYPFRRVIGVEISPELHAIAQRNIERALPTLPCQNIELVCVAAQEYEVPDDVTVVYFYNPFRGPVFADVVKNLVASLARRPRTARIIYLNPVEEAKLLAAGARVIKAHRGLRPGKKWSESNTLKMYEL